VSDKECVFFTKVCEQREPEMCPEEILREKFLEYCKETFIFSPPNMVEYAEIYEEKFYLLSAKCSRYIASRLRHSNLPADTLGCFADDYNLNPFDALCVFLREDSLDSIFGGNLWIDYLRGECEKFCEQCNNEQKKILQIYEELHQEECETLLLDNFLTYCTNYENQRINNAYYQE
jgi:hypothetical protein